MNIERKRGRERKILKWQKRIKENKRGRRKEENLYIGTVKERKKNKIY